MRLRTTIHRLKNRIADTRARPKASGGFTIVELTIATGVFATVLVVAMASFIGIGRVYYKGITLTQTQTTAEQMISQLSGDIQFAPTVVTNYPNGTGLSAGSGSAQFICFGSNRYTFNLYQKVDLSDHDNQTKFGLLRDKLPGRGCVRPFGSGSVPLNNPTELLGHKMRLSKLDVVPARDSSGNLITNLWNIDLTIANGDDDVLQNPGAPNVICQGGLISASFCSVSSQSTTVNRGL